MSDAMRPFPPLPETVRARYGVGPGDLALRSFGVRERDLHVDFARGPRPLVVTEVIACCTSTARDVAVDPELIWQLPIGRRVECLLALLPPGPASNIDVSFRCGAGCAEESEIGISIDELTELQSRAYASEHVAVPLESRAPVALRRPTGRDQLAWLSASPPDEAAAIRAMLETLIVGDDDRRAIDDWLSDAMLDRIGESMDEHDPLVGVTIGAVCPTCGATNNVAIDVEELALQRLYEAQVALLSSVHRLATHYHWTEQDIFATPHWRRQHYLQLIEADQR